MTNETPDTEDILQGEILRAFTNHDAPLEVMHWLEDEISFIPDFLREAFQAAGWTFIPPQAKADVSCASRYLSVLAYAMGFTLWYYSEHTNNTPGWWNSVVDMLRVNDRIILAQSNKTLRVTFSDGKTIAVEECQ